MHPNLPVLPPPDWVVPADTMIETLGLVGLAVVILLLVLFPPQEPR